MRNLRKSLKLGATVTACAVSAITIGCESNAQNDALLGAGLGAGLGAIIGHQSGETGEGAAIGAAVGGAGGYIVGNEKDKQEIKRGSSGNYDY